RVRLRRRLGRQRRLPDRLPELRHDPLLRAPRQAARTDRPQAARAAHAPPLRGRHERLWRQRAVLGPRLRHGAQAPPRTPGVRPLEVVRAPARLVALWRSVAAGGEGAVSRRPRGTCALPVALCGTQRAQVGAGAAFTTASSPPTARLEQRPTNST